jgi:hypothetical protein
VYNDKAKAKQVQEELVDITKKRHEENNKRNPYVNYTISKESFEKMKPVKKSREQLEKDQIARDELKASVYNNSQAYRNLGKR